MGDSGQRDDRLSVQRQIDQDNSWYVASQVQWAEQPGIRTLFEKRFRYFTSCIERARTRLGTGLRLLDAGCGDGYWIKRLRGLSGLEVFGVDYNPLRIERARQVAPPESVWCGSVFEFKAAEPFDVVLLNQVIEHVEGDEALLKRIRSLLRPGGVLILGTPNEGSRLQQWSLRRRGTSFVTDHVHFYMESEIRGKIVDAGFSIDGMMREVFYPGNDRIYYGLMRRGWGFRRRR